VADVVRIEVVPRAQRQIRAAVEWWTRNRPAAPHAITEELRRIFRLLKAQPNIGAIGMHPRVVGVRRVRLDRVRHDLYYRTEETRAVIEILAFWHMSRGRQPPL
jgi:plasmid stabilization system protein ParE